MKILLIRFSPIGDIVMASALIRCMRKSFSDAEIHFLTLEANRGAIEFNPHVDKLHVLAFSSELAIEELKTEDYDLVVDLQGDSKSTIICHHLHRQTLSVTQKSFFEKLFGLPAKNGVGQYFKAVRSLNVINDGAGLDYFIHANEETKKEDIPASHYAGYIIMAIATSGLASSWRAEQWKELCSLLDHPIVLIGTREDNATAHTIAQADEIKIYNACGKFSLNETADLVGKSKLVVSNEKDYLQIAAAYKRPVILLRNNSKGSATAIPYYGDNFLNGTREKYYEIMQSEKTSVESLLNTIKKRL
jgi:ADP-heptose:LPS heptosyltransferase